MVTVVAVAAVGRMVVAEAVDRTEAAVDRPHSLAAVAEATAAAALPRCWLAAVGAMATAAAVSRRCSPVVVAVATVTAAAALPRCLPAEGPAEAMVMAAVLLDNRAAHSPAAADMVAATQS